MPPRPPPRRPPAAAAPPAASAHELVYGLRAGLAVFAQRPADILRVAYAPKWRQEVSELGRWATAAAVPISERGEADLSRLADSEHHEGLVMQTRPRDWTTPATLADRLASARGRAVALDRVRNPYNVGAIVRTAAFFGLDAVVLGAQAPHPALSPQAVRVAEGGAEHVALARTTDLAETLARLRAKGVRIVGADGASVRDARKEPLAGPIVLVMGNEREGLSDRVRAQCDAVVALRGAGSVESLNVAVAPGVLIAALSSGKSR